MSKGRTKRGECWDCIHMRKVPGNAHIRCNNPDPDMKGYLRGVQQGWFYYPSLFDPVWKETLCSNFEEK